MKGISAIVATLLMLIITIGLAGLAYTYISGVFTTKTETISLVDAYCSGGTATFVVRNEGTSTISSSSLTLVSVDEDCTNDPTLSDIPAGGTITLTASGCSGGRYQSYRLRGPSNAIQLSVYCP